MSSNSLSKPRKNIGVGVIRNLAGEILIDRRLSKGEMGGLWEFPGGKIEPGETIPECIRREIKEELDIEVLVKDLIVNIDHDYVEFGVTLHVYSCQYVRGTPKSLESEEIRWVTPSELDMYDFPEANYQIIELLQQSE